MFSYDESVKLKKWLIVTEMIHLIQFTRRKLKSQESNQVKEEDPENENQSNIYLASILFLNQNNWANLD